MDLSIVIPCYNEETREGVSLSDRVYSLCNYLNSVIEDFEVILVSDGSTDNTEGIILDLAYSIPNIVAYIYKQNRGKGNAIREGVSVAHGDYIIFMDADLSTDITSIDVFKSTLDNSKFDSVIGIRSQKYNSSIRRGLSVLSHFCMTKILRLEVKDTQCGFKMFKSDILKLFCSEYQTCNNWLFDAELLVFLKENNYSVYSKDVDWVNSKDSRVQVLGGTLSSCFELLRIFLNRKHYKVKRNIK